MTTCTWQPRTLVVVLCETRGWEITADSFFAHLLAPLRANLALCVGRTAHEGLNPLYEVASHVWTTDEPENWAEAYEQAVGNREWEALLDFNPQFLAPISHPRWGPPESSVPGSGAVVFYFRRFLARCLERPEVRNSYDWFVITRSDFMWPRPHPPLSLLDGRHLYALDGERYSGVSDRHHVVPYTLLSRYLAVPDPIFSTPRQLQIDLRRRLGRRASELNPERFWALRLHDLGLLDRLRYLPYLPYTVRGVRGTSRWTQGTWDAAAGYFVKYPYELARSRAVQRVIRDERSWQRYFDRRAGLVMRTHVWVLHRLLSAKQAVESWHGRFMRWLLRHLGRHPVATGDGGPAGPESR